MIEAAIEVIDASGEAAVRVQDILDRVGVQAPVLYRHFTNREGLVMAAQATRLVGDMNTEVDRFTAAVLAAGSRDEFDRLLGLLVTGIAAADRRALRWKRVNVIGSTYGRPELAQAVAELQQHTISGIAAAFGPAQERGWIRSELDLNAFAAWLAGQLLGRVVIELGDSGVADEAWNEIAVRAIRGVLFD